MKRTRHIIYNCPFYSSFILRDIEILSETYCVTPHKFDTGKKWLVPYQFVKQFLFLTIKIWSADVVICHFAGYASFLPALFCKFTHTPCFIIVAGNDGSKFPDFNYGNYTKKLLGFFTGKSLQLATHILPVHESLYFQDYNYYDKGKPAQGYSYFFPKAKNTPHTAIYYGYDSGFFKYDIDAKKKKNSFITIGGLNDNYAFKRKGFDLIIELAKTRPDLNFTLVGWDGIRKIDVPDNVNLLRFMSQKEVVEALCQHEYYFQLSIMEGFPNALAEAMLCGCIPIGSNVSGIPFIIGNTGYILHKRDVNELNNLVDIAIADGRKQTLPQLARKRIIDNFSYGHRKAAFDKVIDNYCNIVNRPNQSD
ncbi:MAG: glycosyltransferase family 4 protein [Flavobacteriales bacterium]|nr:glycosyltransferase family 4 protein [Flavobacteriales bacterium]